MIMRNKNVINNHEVKNMFRTLASTNIDANHDYGYIQVFIDYLKQIIEILKDLFSSLGGKKEDPTTTTEKVGE